MKKLLLLLLFFISCTIATAQDTIRVCTYNVLNYSQSNEDGRSEKFRRIFREIKPDIVVAQELVDEFAQGELIGTIDDNRFIFFMPAFNNGPDTDNSVFFNARKLRFIEASYIPTNLRDIARYTFIRINTDDIGQVKETKDTLHIFSVHLTPNNNETAAGDRMFEIGRLKENMPMGADDNVIVTGDFNFYSPEEPGYIMLTNTAFQRLSDPLGEWVRNSPQYLKYYTQSPRIKADAGCGGGVVGGMDDRFDFILHSAALGDNLVTDSYTTFGNDGENRLNSSIDDPPNKKVSAQLASDLRCASDHLPVYADFIFSVPTSVEENLLKEISFKENSGNISISLPSPGTVIITDILGRILLKENATAEWNFKKEGLQNGVYFIRVQSGSNSKNFTFFR